MKYLGFHIENYKAIEAIDVPVSRETIPLIGINESGKTTILQAILAFDSDKDHLLEGSHVNVKNIYKPRAKDKICNLTAIVEIIDASEASQIIQEARLKTDGPLYQWAETNLSPGKRISVRRVTSIQNELTSEYELVDLPDELKAGNDYRRLLSSIKKHLPNILYFDDFSDRVPTEIPFAASYVETGKRVKTSSQIREWQDIVEEVLLRTGGGELDLATFCAIENPREREDALSDIAEVLNEEIVKEWKNLKLAHSRFDESESDNLELSLSCDKQNDKYIFAFNVKDTESENHRRTFDISQRSKGFQWYFNFIMKLKFNPKYKDNPHDAIYLLDEPGSYLHSSAQTELLKKLMEISEDNTILFCTHSQYLLDPEIINLNDVRIVEKKDGTISIFNYGESPIEKDRGAYSALDDALHLKIGASFDLLNNAILFEGVSDWCFYNIFVDTKGATLIPGHGCSQLKTLISLLIASANKFLVVLDNDEEGRKAHSTYKDTFGELFTSNAFCYDFAKRRKKFELEDILSPDNIKEIKAKTGCSSIKKAIVKLYYSPSSVKDAIVNFLDETSKANIDSINKAISSHFE